MKIRVKFTDMPPDFNQEDNCYIRALRMHYEVEISNDPDFVFYGVFGTEFLLYPQAVKIYLMFEPVYPNFNDCDYAVGALDLTLEGRYFKCPPMMNFGERELYALMAEVRDQMPVPSDRKFCNFVYANATGGKGAHLRVDFCNALSTYKRVDCPGRVLNNMPRSAISPRYKGRTGIASNWLTGKLEFISHYKFTIAFENASMLGWSTEKLIHPLLMRSIPIYWGNNEVGEYFNPEAFVYCSDADAENGFSETIARVKAINENEEAYQEMLRQPPLRDSYPIHWENNLAEFLARIVDRGPVPLDKNPIGFSSADSQDFVSQCRDGKVGMASILKTGAQGVAGWLHYKLKK